MKKILAFVLSLTFILTAVPSGAAVRYRDIYSRQELINYVTKQSETLAPSVNVRINNYSEEEYMIDFTTFLPIQISELNGTLRGDEAEITYTFTYTQAERILQFISGRDVRLDAKEIETLQVLMSVYNEIIDSDMALHEKQLAIHDYLVLNVEFDHSTTLSNDAFTPYGAMVNKIAVCQGYAESARILLTMAGIENGTLTGLADGINHMWNVVRLDDGEFYHMDVTWDDDRVFDDGTNVLSRAFLNVTDAQMDLSHDWDMSMQLNQFGEGCTATEYNYLLRNGMWVTSNEEYTNLVAEKYRAGERDIEVLFVGMSIDDADIQSTLDAIGSIGYTGFHILSANVLWMRYK